MANMISDPRGIPQVICGVTYSSPSSYGGVHSDDDKSISTMPWFSRTAIVADGEKDFERLRMFAWVGQLYLGVETEELSSRVWCDIISMNDTDLACHGTNEVKRTRHVAEVAKGMMALSHGPII